MASVVRVSVAWVLFGAIAAVVTYGESVDDDFNGVIGSESRYTQAGLGVAQRLLQEPYLSSDKNHQGLLLHSVYHRPNGWDHVPEGRKIPCGEASMWGDYHLLELGVLLQRLIQGGAYPTFFDAD